MERSGCEHGYYLQQVEAQEAPRRHDEGSVTLPPARRSALPPQQPGVAPRVHERAAQEDAKANGQHLAEEVDGPPPKPPARVAEAPEPQRDPEEDRRGPDQHGDGAQRQAQPLLPRHGVGRQGGLLYALALALARVEALGHRQPVEEGRGEQAGLEGGGEGAGEGVPVEPVAQLQGERRPWGKEGPAATAAPAAARCCVIINALREAEQVEVRTERAQDALEDGGAVCDGVAGVEARYL